MISFLLCTIRRAEENQSKNAIKHSPTRRSYHNTPIRSSSAAPLPGLLVLLQILRATPDQWFRRWCIDAPWFRRSSSDYPVCMDDKCRRRRWIVKPPALPGCSTISGDTFHVPIISRSRSRDWIPCSSSWHRDTYVRPVQAWIGVASQVDRPQEFMHVIESVRAV